MKSMFRILTLVLFGSIILNSCVKEFDEPQFPFTDPDITTNATVNKIKQIFTNSGVSPITDDLVFSAVVIANDSTGNFYKKIVVQDSTGGLEVLIDGKEMFNKYPVGRRVFIKAKGLTIGDYNGLLQLGYAFSEGSVVAIPYKLIDDFVVGGSLHNELEPKIVKIGEFDESLVSTLIKFENVEFANASLNTTYADGINKTDVNKTLTNCSKKEFLVRTSGYAKFATDTVAAKNGSLTCVLSLYKTTYQGYLRSLKDVDFQNERCNSSSGNETLVTIKSLRDQFNSGNPVIGSKLKIKGVVISDRVNNNLDSKNVIIQDGTAGINVRFDAAHSFNMNDQIEVVVSNLELSEYSKLLQLNNTPIDFGKKVGTTTITPNVMTVGQLLTNGENLESTLVTLKDVTLTGGTTYKDTKIYAGDGTGSINLYSRSAATFASNPIPTSKVDITAIVGQYNDNYQISIRNLDDVKGGGTNPGTEIFKDDFESGLGKWQAISAKGDEVWAIDAAHGNPGACAKMSGYNVSSKENEDWLISSKIDLTSVTAANLSFDNAKNYTGNDMELLISKDYSGSGSPAAANWTTLNYNKSTGSFTYVGTGPVSLSSFIGNKIYIAFKYTSTTSASSTWEIDNVKVTQ
jgi:hypothetical protein